MNFRKQSFAVVMVLSLAVASSAQAQWAVFDPSNFAQNLSQVKQMVTQLDQMRMQLEQAKKSVKEAEAQTKAMTGSRGMGRIVTDAARNYTPGQWQSDFSAKNPQLAKLASDIKNSAGLLSKADLKRINGAYADLMVKRGQAAADATAANAQVFAESNTRFSRLQSLMDRIDTAGDEKAIQDLQARIQVEQVMLQNEAIRAQSMNAMLMQQQQVELERQRQSALNEKFKL
ncbi:type IV secretion system protein (plasmid) [Xanthomonas hydrangeae]|uniref:type IV secretion system protein n=1 Tax=Xanthomonas hydrangeae TaxID=2775159 RepID=UPI0019659579|nr:type IV secretion system protein [Xanthomonas hydrangeae]CAD7741375.1 type IV secretion system protein [Xanthomonas hydrangeae]CAD7747900.1 type IV secretion system protein [Xanthomonas hydrangeae]CAD7747901.1 type IV secretion system protein [Xanthomonas hydrangeae]CAD7748222.1 type IV secretion system protein [Xanthomonas hydrangeae]